MLGVTIDGSLKKGWTAGPLTVLGHGILELILIIIMIFGFKDFFSKATVAGFIGLFCCLQFVEANRQMPLRNCLCRIVRPLLAN